MSLSASAFQFLVSVVWQIPCNSCAFEHKNLKARNPLNVAPWHGECPTLAFQVCSRPSWTRGSMNAYW